MTTTATHYGPFWSRTLKVFRSETVLLRLISGRELIGDIEAIGDTSCTLKRSDGSIEVLPFDQLRECLPAVSRL